MRFTDKKGNGFYKGKKGGFEFTISTFNDVPLALYVVASSQKKDIRLNTLWIKLTFETLEKAKEFCENFDWKKYDCIGEDAN